VWWRARSVIVMGQGKKRGRTGLGKVLGPYGDLSI